MQHPPHTLPLIAALLAALLAAACAGPDRLTLAEYAEFCAQGIASATDLIEPEEATWADIIEIAEPSIERLQGVEPPEELATFHRLTLKTLQFVLDTALEQPPDQPANPLAFGLNAIQIATQLRRAIQNLPTPTRQHLTTAGCL